MGVDGRRRIRSLMGSAVHRKGTTVGDSGDGLAWSKGRRFRLCHPRTVSTGGRRRVRSPLGSAVSKRGTTVGDGGDRLARSKGRRTGLCHRKMAATSVCAQEEGRQTRPAAVGAVAAGIISVPPADMGGVEKWEAESSSLLPSSISEKCESSAGWCRRWVGVSSGKVSVAENRGASENGSAESDKERY